MPSSISRPEGTRLPPTLQSLVAPAGADEFLRESWKKSAFHAPASAARLAFVLAAFGSGTIEALLEQSRQFVVLGTDALGRSGSKLSMADALAAYRESGATLYLRMGDDFLLSHWTGALAEELGELPIGVTSLFAVRERRGTPAHLDWNENFTIQVRGTKQWRVARAPGEFLIHPVSNWALGDPPPLYADASHLPTEMPRDAKEYLLTPGSVLYVPRGFIHQVTSVDAADSLSLNLSFPPTPWAVILCTLLGNRLLEDPAFRVGLAGAFGAGWGREEALARLPALVATLTRHAGGVGEDLREIMGNPAKLRDYLARRGYPRI